jgi:hypothetical protein
MAAGTPLKTAKNPAIQLKCFTMNDLHAKPTFFTGIANQA